jgi:hypothetical protein
MASLIEMPRGGGIERTAVMRSTTHARGALPFHRSPFGSGGHGRDGTLLSYAFHGPANMIIPAKGGQCRPSDAGPRFFAFPHLWSICDTPFGWGKWKRPHAALAWDFQPCRSSPTGLPDTNSEPVRPPVRRRWRPGSGAPGPTGPCRRLGQSVPIAGS